MNPSSSTIDSTLANALSMPPGRYRAPCPHCGKGPSDKALSIKVDEAGACWRCWRCDDSGGIPRGDRMVRVDRPSAMDNGRAREQLNKLWSNTAPLDLDKHPIAAKYLASRGLELQNNPPSDLRYGDVDYWRRGDDGPVHVGTFPCIVAVIRNAAGEPLSLHRTYLTPDGAGKADLDPPRKLCTAVRPGGVAGGAVRLYEARDKVLLAEGIETALAAGVIFQKPAWACLSTSMMQKVVLPQTVHDVTIAADHDEAGIDAAKALAERLHAESRTVRIELPDQPGTDWADVIREVA